MGVKNCWFPFVGIVEFKIEVEKSKCTDRSEQTLRSEFFALAVQLFSNTIEFVESQRIYIDQYLVFYFYQRLFLF